MKTPRLKNRPPDATSDTETIKIPPGKFAIVDSAGRIMKDPNGHYQIYDSWLAAQTELNYFHSRRFLGRSIEEGKHPPTPSQIRASMELATNPEFLNLLGGIKAFWDQLGLSANPEKSRRLYDALVSTIEAYDEK